MNITHQTIKLDHGDTVTAVMPDGTQVTIGFSESPGSVMSYLNGWPAAKEIEEDILAWIATTSADQGEERAFIVNPKNGKIKEYELQ